MSFADDLVAAFEPWMTEDLESYLRSIASMFDEVEGFIEEIEGDPIDTVLYNTIAYEDRQHYYTNTIDCSVPGEESGAWDPVGAATFEGVSGDALIVECTGNTQGLTHPIGVEAWEPSYYVRCTVELEVASTRGLKLRVLTSANVLVEETSVLPIGSIGVHDLSLEVESLPYGDSYKMQVVTDGGAGTTEFKFSKPMATNLLIPGTRPPLDYFSGATAPGGFPWRTAWSGEPYESNSYLRLVTREVPTYDPWVVLFNADLAPAAALPFLAMLVGETLPSDISEAAKREWIKDRPNSRRGTPTAIKYAAQRYLTGSRMISYRERWTGSIADVDHVTVNTFNHEMGNTTPEQVEAEILSVFPADMVLNYQAIDGQTWADVISDYTDWDDLLADVAHPTWADVVADLPDSNIFTRPGP